MKHIILSIIVITVLTHSNCYAQKNTNLDKLIFEEQYGKAIPILIEKIKKNPQNSGYEFRLGKLYQLYQQPTKALKHLEKAHKLSPQSIPILIGLSKAQFACGRYPDTEKTLLKLQRIDSTNYTARLLLAKTYIAQSSYSKSLKIYNKLVQKDTLNPYLYKQIGNLNDKMLNYIASLTAYLKAYELNPKDLSVILHVIQSYCGIQAYQQALQMANDALQIYPEYAPILRKKAQVLIGLEWYENALPIMQNLYKRHKLNAFGLKQLGICYMQTRQYDKGIDSFLKCGAIFENDPMLNFYMGVCYSRLKEYKKGIEHLKNALFYTTSPLKASMHLYLAKAYSAEKQFDKAIDQYKKNLELDNNNPEVLYEIATAYEEFGNNKKQALSYYSKYIGSTDDVGGERYEYAKSRILRIKEKIHFEK